MAVFKNILKFSPQDFIRYLRQENIFRFCFVYDSAGKKIISSHRQLQCIADFIQSDKRDFMDYEGIFLQVSPRYDILQGAFIHRTNRGQAAGGVRYWSHNTLEEYLRDGMRLLVGMTMKNTLVGLWWGGGKEVMAHNPLAEKNNPLIRASIYEEFGELISSIRGCYVTAEDVGTDVTDMANVFFKTRFTTYIPHRLGGSGNPSVPTASGVVCGVESAFDFLGMGTLKGMTIAVQGMGHVAEPPIKYLFDMDVKHVIACDINPYVVKEVKGQLSGKNLDVSVVPPDDLGIYSVECDIFAPCATGAILNPSTIPMLKAKIVCGAANNQLEDSIRDDEMLFGRKIVYVPDFLTNRMGIMSCANEQYGYVTKDSSIEMHLSKEWEYSIYQASNKVLKKSAETARPPGQVAFEMASRLSFQNHPICGHRGQEIINSLVANRWCEISSLDRKVMST